MISVIVPIYKVEECLCRCVDSLLAQTFSDFELILVDDGSPDRCGGICDEYAKLDSRIVVIHKENGGLSDARNAGLAVARGEYIAFVDSDDWVAPGYLDKLHAVLCDTGADICECEVFRTDGESCGETGSGDVQIYDTVSALAQLIQEGAFYQHVWNKLYRRETIGDIFFPKGKTNEDEFWTYRIFGRANRVAKIDNVLYNYFQRPGSIMGSGYSLKRLDALEAKAQRQHYLEEFYPELSGKGKVNFYFSCVYAAQMSIKYLEEPELAQARQIIEAYVKGKTLLKSEQLYLSGGSKFWYAILKRYFWFGCKLRNVLGWGF